MSRNKKTKRILFCALVIAGVLSAVGKDANADFVFGEPVDLKSVIPVIDPVYESPCSFSYDGLEMYIESNRPGGQGDYDLWVMKRASAAEDWGPPENLGPVVNGPTIDGPASISTNGLTLYFQSERSDGYGKSDVWMTTRTTKNDLWAPPVNLGPNVNSPSYDNCPWISPDNLELYFSSWRDGGYGQMDIYVTRRATMDDPWGDAVNLGPVVNSPYNEYDPHITSDGLLLLFDDWPFQDTTIPGGYGGADIWMTRRKTVSAPWQEPVNLGHKVNSTTHDFLPRISLDSSMLYFTTLTAGSWNNWVAPIIPICNFNSDGIVNAADVCIMVDNWQTDEPLCDIGPMPWGDGVVDVHDLIVLAEHLFEEIPPAEEVE